MIEELKFEAEDEYCRLLQRLDGLSLDKLRVSTDPLIEIRESHRADLQAVLLNEDLTIKDDRKLRNSLARYAERIRLLLAQVENENFKQSNPKDFDKSPRNKAKTAQDLFSPVEALQILDDNNLDRVVISPEFVNLEFLKRIGIFELVVADEEVPKSNITLLRKFGEESIKHLKLFLSSLEPIREEYMAGTEQDYFRVYRIGYGRHEGKILRTINPASLPRSKTFTISDLPNTDLSIAHVKQRQRLEHSQLSALLKKVKLLHTYASSGNATDEEYNTKAKVLDEDIERFNNPINLRRILIKTRLAPATSLQDKLNRKNWPARAAQLLGLTRSITIRVRELANIGKYIDDDKVSVAPLVEMQIEPLRELLNSFEEFGDKLTVFSESPVDQQKLQQSVATLVRVRDKLREVNLEPYFSVAKKIIAQLNIAIEKLQSAIDSNDNTAAPVKFVGEPMVKVYLELQMARFMHRLFKLESDMTDPSCINRHFVGGKIADLIDIRLQLVNRRKVGRGVKVPAYGVKINMLMKLTDKLMEALVSALNSDDQTKSYTEIKSCLKETISYLQDSKDSDDSTLVA